jgi:magnesium and cobalt transporter
VLESGHSRFPVSGEDRDDVTGILLAKDLLRFAINRQEEFNLNLLIRPTIFVPESKRLNVLLKEFRSNRNHMAIVVDEYGGVVGLVTIEDILEEIVGDIADESDTEEVENIVAKTAGEFSVNALTPIEEFNTYFKTNYSDVEFDTIGGLIMHHLGYLPKVGETTDIDTITFTISSADARRILWLNVKQTAPVEKSETLVKTANE